MVGLGQPLGGSIGLGGLHSLSLAVGKLSTDWPWGPQAGWLVSGLHGPSSNRLLDACSYGRALLPCSLGQSKSHSQSQFKRWGIDCTSWWNKLQSIVAIVCNLPYGERQGMGSERRNASQVVNVSVYFIHNVSCKCKLESHLRAWSRALTWSKLIIEQCFSGCFRSNCRGAKWKLNVQSGGFCVNLRWDLVVTWPGVGAVKVVRTGHILGTRWKSPPAYSHFLLSWVKIPCGQGTFYFPVFSAPRTMAGT